jgi:hypothetical protein
VSIDRYPVSALTDHPDRANAWRKRAEELRAMAMQFDDPGARQDMLDLAAQWERLADRVAQRSK